MAPGVRDTTWSLLDVLDGKVLTALMQEKNLHAEVGGDYLVFIFYMAADYVQV